MLDIRIKVDNLDDIASKIESFVEDNRTHFYKEDEIDMVEIHADQIYTYDTDDVNLPQIPLFGGNPRVRLPSGQKAMLCFGQDEAIFRSFQLNES